MNHRFECGVCRYEFIALDDYNDDPKTRNCPKCGKAEGQVLYHGCDRKVYGISDDLGIKGVVNPVNGKKYDSKSKYHADVKASGHVVMGSDAKVQERKELRGNFDCRKELSQAIDQTGFMDKIKKGKK